jgi:peroxiredoxin
LAELRTLVQPGEQLNLYAISVDTPAQSKQFAEKISADGKGNISYPILSDTGHRLIDAFGIRDPAYNGQQFEGIPHPSVYVIDKDGRVAWNRVEKDYKERPINDEVRAALKNLKMI